MQAKAARNRRRGGDPTPNFGGTPGATLPSTQRPTLWHPTPTQRPAAARSTAVVRPRPVQRRLSYTYGYGCHPEFPQKWACRRRLPRGRPCLSPNAQRPNAQRPNALHPTPTQRRPPGLDGSRWKRVSVPSQAVQSTLQSWRAVDLAVATPEHPTPRHPTPRTQGTQGSPSPRGGPAFLEGN